MCLEEELKIVELRYIATKRKLYNAFPCQYLDIKEALNRVNFRDVWYMVRERYDENKDLFKDYCTVKKELTKLQDEIKKRDYHFEEEEKIMNQ